jgi:hypothetical protein
MSMLSRLKGILSSTPPSEPAAPTAEHASRHQRREAGRERHHKTGEPAWEASDRLADPGGPTRNPDAAPEIFGGG